jgi:adenosylcobinamide kinase/adenosylcobinamide-phosphate guanylyltransferase
VSNKIIFITGGARSGKSSFAMKEASKILGKKAYIATAEALDKEMEERIEKHKKDRGNNWDTYEEPIKIPGVVNEIKNKYSAVVIDCLTLWLSNLMHSNKNVRDEIEAFCSSLSTVNCSLFTVSNEVGMGIVPDNKMAREFRDWAGFLNQKIAEIADEVYLVTAGIPMRIKERK